MSAGKVSYDCSGALTAAASIKEAGVTRQSLLSLNKEPKAFHLNKSVELTAFCGDISGSEQE